MGELPAGARDAVLAAADLVSRSGATGFDVGFLHDDVPISQAGWWATARYQGARICVEDQPGPVEAMEALALRILTGARCRCGRLVALSDLGAVIGTGQVMADGKPWTPELAAAAGQCRWRRRGARWIRGCEGTPPGKPGKHKKGKRRG